MNEEHKEEEQAKDPQLFDEEEEEKLPSMRTQDSTTCETREPSKYDIMDKLFGFLGGRRSGSVSSLASEATSDCDELNPVLCGYFSRLVQQLV